MAVLYGCGPSQSISSTDAAGLTTDGGIVENIADDAGSRDTQLSLGVSIEETSAKCGMAVPSGTQEAADPSELTYSGQTCPSFTIGEANTLQSSGIQRTFLLLGPDNVDADDPLPVVFLWHWTSGSPEAFRERAQLDEAVRQHRFIAVVPRGESGFFEWPIFRTSLHLNRELRFFDDLLACLAQQRSINRQLPFSIDKNCISSLGVSSGALWTARLASERGDFLASFVSVSGGSGSGQASDLIPVWKPSTHRMPALVMWGGPRDQCYLTNFENKSKQLETALTANGHPIVECVHNCDHSVPPVDGQASTTQFDSVWRFILDHPFWLPDGASSYTNSAYFSETALPTWCGAGIGGATLRQGACPTLGCQF